MRALAKRRLQASVLVIGVAVLSSPHELLAQTCFTLEPNFAGTPGGLGSAGAATEASTTQVLELISHRRQEASQECGPGMVRVSGVCQSMTTRGTAPGQPKSAMARRAKSPKQEPVDDIDIGRARIADDYAGYGVWTEAYLEHEKRTGLTVGQTTDVKRIQKSAGVVGGFDRTFRLGADRGFQIGVTGGYSATRQRFSDTSSTEPVDTTFRITVPGFPTFDKDIVLPIDHVIQQSVRQEVNGPNAGLYASYFKGGFYTDVLMKADFLEFSRRTVKVDTFSENLVAVVVQQNIGLPDPGCLFVGTAPLGGFFFKGKQIPQQPNGAYYLLSDPTAHVTIDNQTASLRNIVLANNIGYRFDLRSGFWLEPTAGVRYTIADFDDGAAAVGLRDGHVFRVQGGARFGHTALVPDRFVWVNSIAAIYYSDLEISGFVVDAGGLSPSSVEADEGKPRVMGILSNKIDLLNGVSLFGEVNGRVGEDLWAVGGRLGGRIEW